MHISLFFTFRLLALILGSLLLYTLFLYEDEQGKMQNHLEGLWLKIAYGHQQAVSVHVAFMQKVASLIDQGLSYLFGPRIISLRFLGVSACYSIGSISLVIMFVEQEAVCNISEISGLETRPFFVYAVLLSSAFTFFALGIIPTIKLFSKMPKLLIRYISIGLAIFGACILSLIVRLLYSPSYIVLCFAVLPIALAISSDIVFTVITRKILRTCSSLNSLFKLSLLLITNIVIAFTLVLFPVFWGFIAVVVDSFFSSGDIEHLAHIVILIAGSGNLIIGLTSFAIVILALTLLIHRVLWPILERPMYLLQQVGITRRKKSVLIIGFALIGMSIQGTAMPILKEVLKALID